MEQRLAWGEAMPNPDAGHYDLPIRLAGQLGQHDLAAELRSRQGGGQSGDGDDGKRPTAESAANGCADQLIHASGQSASFSAAAELQASFAIFQQCMNGGSGECYLSFRNGEPADYPLASLRGMAGDPSDINASTFRCHASTGFAAARCASRRAGAILRGDHRAGRSAMNAFQDHIPHNNCWGCGPHNPTGLHVRSQWQGDVAVCEFTPQRDHCAGPPQVVNGGIIASVIDCHAVGTAMAACYRAEGREIGSGALIWCVTGELKVRYRRPAAIDQPLRVTARVVSHEGKKIELACEAFSGEALCATADVLAIRVDDAWLQSQR